MTTAYVCHQCGTRMGDALPWCRTCHDDTLAVAATTRQPLPSGRLQRITICVLFCELGVMHKATRMRDISSWISRDVFDYDQLTAVEADTAITALRERCRPPGSVPDGTRITYGPGGTLFIDPDCLAPESCICGPDSTGEAPDCRPDCPQHGANAPYDPHSDIGEAPF